MADILKIDGNPIMVPTGPLSDGTLARVEKAVGLHVPDGKHLAVLMMLDKKTGDPMTGGAGVAVRIGNNWQLTAEAKKVFGGPAAGFVGLVGTF